MNIRFILLFSIFIIMTGFSILIIKWDLKYMSKDSIEENKGYKSIIVWKLKVKDYTNDTKDYKYTFAFGDEFTPYKAHWTTENNVAHYDALFAVQAQPVDIELFSILMPSKYFGNSTLIIHSYKAFNVPVGKIIYLGEYNMEILERNLNKDPSKPTTYNLNTTFNYESDGKEAAMKQFQEYFPKLFEQFKGNFETVKPYLFYDEFNSLTPLLKISDVETRWAIWKNGTHCDAFSDFNGFSMHPKDNLCYSQTTKQNYKLPENCTIKLQSHWKEGLNSTSYGFLIGADQYNCIHFDITAMGEVRVWKILDGKNVNTIYSEKKNSAVNECDGKIRNEHYIEKRGDTLTLFINGKEITSFKNPLAIDPDNWAIGISVTDNQTVEFNKLTVTDLSL